MGHFGVSLALSCFFIASLAAPRDGKFGIFNVVKFSNDACKGNDNKNGTCYTEDECESRGGESSGSCAEGYGICCVFTMSCGDTKSENLTYFTSGKQSTGSCNARICKVSSDVVQLRLDFKMFVINGPSTNTNTQYSTCYGASVLSACNTPTYEYGRCNDDSFSVTSHTNLGSPTICGTNTGYHMFVDASADCNVLSFHLSDSPTGSSMRQWDIEVTQYTRGSLNKAPDGCLQYHYGDKTGYLETFNYAEGVHLAYQNQLICIRREENMCKICYTQVAATDFQISGGGGLSAGFVDNSGACGGEGSARDLIIIPSPIKSTANEDLVGDGKFCGAVFVTATGATPATVCTKSTPFQLRFISDGGEQFTGGPEQDIGGSAGFKIYFEQNTC